MISRLIASCISNHFRDLDDTKKQTLTTEHKNIEIAVLQVYITIGNCCLVTTNMLHFDTHHELFLPGIVDYLGKRALLLSGATL